MLTLVPARDREALLGDLHEDAVHATRARLSEIARVGLSYQREPYRDDRARLGILVLLVVGLALLRLVPLASTGMEFMQLEGAVWRAAAVFWSQDTLIAAIMTGLIVGRAPVMPAYATSARSHVAVMLAVTTLLSAPEAFGGAVASAMLLGATAMADAVRRHVEPPNTMA